ncbi:MAG: sigma 54-interacting transcriptional regulator, partial [Phycisphaerae bacterium]
MSDPSATFAPPALDHLLGNAPDGIFVLDRQRGYVLFNKASERITGHSADQLIGRQCTCADILNCQDDYGRSLSGILCPAKSLFDGNQTTARQRMRIHRPDGSTIWVETVYTPIHDPDGQVEYVLGIVRDVSEAKEKEDRLLKEMGRLRDRVQRLSQEQKAHFGFDNIISRSPLMTPVFEKVRAALHNAAAVLIHGESGAGKAFVARTIHSHGLQAEGPFIPINCAAYSRGLIESELFGYVKGAFPDAIQDYPGILRSAEGGTLFIDEITEMPLETQTRFLRMIQDRQVRPLGGTCEYPFNVRIIAASHLPPRDAVARGRLREDLFFRLSVITIDLPPLRRRREDIPFLVQSMLEMFNRTHLRKVREV